MLETRTDLTVAVFERASNELLSSELVHGRRSGCGAISFASVHRSEPPTKKADRWIESELAGLR